MDRSFYTGAVGAIAHQERLNIIAKYCECKYTWI